MDKIREVREWTEFGDRDLQASSILMKSRPQPVEIVCFHCQQCAEKYLKAYLVYLEEPFEKTHNLISLSEKCMLHDPDFGQIRKECERLNTYSVITRYPSDLDLAETDAETALRDATAVKDQVMRKIREFILP